MVKSLALGKCVFEVSLIKYRTGVFYFDLMCNFNFEQDHCPMASMNVGIGRYMFEVGVHYKDHRMEYDEHEG